MYIVIVSARIPLGKLLPLSISMMHAGHLEREGQVESTDQTSALTAVLDQGYLKRKEGAAELAQATEALRSGATVEGAKLITLSERELEIIGGAASGLTNKEIGERLGLSPQTVKNHFTSILRKLRVNDRTAAVMICLKLGYLRLDDI